jgi:hypothetical protein
MDDLFRDRGFRLTPIEPGARAEGFVFTTLDAGTKDAALVLSVSPGSYTLEISTAGAAGEALADIYAVPQ